MEAADKQVAQSLHKQSTAERERREKIITAEAKKKETELNADAYKYQQIIEAEGDATKKRIAADAEFYRILKHAEAEQQSIDMITLALNKQGGMNTMKTRLSDKYFETLKSLGKNKTIIVPHNLSNVASMVAAGQSVFEEIKDESK